MRIAAFVAAIVLLLPVAIIDLPVPHIAEVEAETLPEVVVQPPPPPELTLPQKIDAAMIAANISTTTMRAIAWCESHYTQFNPDGSPMWSPTADVGAFQINQIHRSELKKLGLDAAHSLDDNIAFAIVLYKRNGTRDWNNSAYCWRPLLKHPDRIP